MLLIFVCAFVALATAEDKKLLQANEITMRAYNAVMMPKKQMDDHRAKKAVVKAYHTSAGTLDGSYRLLQVDENNYFSEFRVGSYQHVDIKKDGKDYLFDNAPFPPLASDYFFWIIPPHTVIIGPEDAVRSIKNEQVNGEQAVCVDFDTIEGKRKSNEEACFSKAHDWLLRTTMREHEYHWSKYVPFRGKNWPTHADAYEHGAKVLEADFEFSDVPQLTSAQIVVPAFVKEQPQCGTRTPPKQMSAPDPQYPAGVHIRQVLHVIVKAKVGDNGDVTAAQVQQSVGDPFDKAAIDAVKKWRFAPGLCDGAPIETTTEVEVDFATNP